MPPGNKRSLEQEVKELSEEELRSRIQDGRFGQVYSPNRFVAEDRLRHLEAVRNGQLAREANVIAKKQMLIAKLTLVAAVIAAVAAVVGLFY